MSQHHLRSVHIQNLVEQNEQLRRRNNKLTQIQSYVQLLLDKLQSLQKRQRSLLQQSSHLKQKNRQNQIKIAQLQNNHGQQMRYVFTQHDQILCQKDHAIIQLKSIVDKQVQRAKILQQQIKSQILATQRQSNKVLQLQQALKSSQLQQQNIINHYQQLLMQQRNKTSNIQQDTVLLIQTIDEERLLYRKQKQNWQKSANDLLLALKQKQNQISILTQTKNNMQSDNVVLAQYNVDLQNRIKHYQQQISAFKSKIQMTESQNHQLNLTINQLSRDLQSKKIEIDKLKQNNNTYVNDNKRLLFLLEESDKQNVFLRQKNSQIQQYSQKQIQLLRLENTDLRQEIQSLHKNIKQLDNNLATKIYQNKQLNNQNYTIQNMIQQSKKQINLLNLQINQLTQNILNQKKYSTQLQLQNKQLREAIKIQRQATLDIEQISKKIQKQNHILANQNHNITRILNNPRQMNKQYLDQMDKLLKNFHEQRQCQTVKHQLQKQKIKEMCEFQFKQKQLQYCHQISILQQQLKRALKFDTSIPFSKRNQRSPLKYK